MSLLPEIWNIINEYTKQIIIGAKLEKESLIIENIQTKDVYFQKEYPSETSDLFDEPDMILFPEYHKIAIVRINHDRKIKISIISCANNSISQEIITPYFGRFRLNSRRYLYDDWRKSDMITGSIEKIDITTGLIDKENIDFKQHTKIDTFFSTKTGSVKGQDLCAVSPDDRLIVIQKSGEIYLLNRENQGNKEILYIANIPEMSIYQKSIINEQYLIMSSSYNCYLYHIINKIWSQISYRVPLCIYHNLLFGTNFNNLSKLDLINMKENIINTRGDIVNKYSSSNLKFSIQNNVCVISNLSSITHIFTESNGDIIQDNIIMDDTIYKNISLI